jgi:hypothetical protein
VKGINVEMSVNCFVFFMICFLLVFSWSVKDDPAMAFHVHHRASLWTNFERCIALLTRRSPDTDCDLFSGQNWDISLLLESSFSSRESGMFDLQIL